MFKKIFIYGAGGGGRELAFQLSIEKHPNITRKVEGFIDDTENLWGKTVDDIPVLGGFDYLMNCSGDVAVTIFDYPAVRQKLIEKIKKNNKIKFPVIISSTSIFSQFVEYGEGCIVDTLSYISTNTKLGKFVFVNGGTRIGHDAIVDDFTTIYSGVLIGGGVSIGSGCLIGSGSTILPKVKIGDGSVIGGGSMVLRNVPSGVVVAGVPAKTIREVK